MNTYSRRAFVRRGGAAAGVVFAGGLLAACGSSDSGGSGGSGGTGGGGGKGKHVTELVPNVTNDYWAQWKQGGSQAAAALGLAFDQQGFDDSPEKQISAVESSRVTGTNLLLTCTVRAQSSPQIVRSVKEQGVVLGNAHSNAAWSTPLEQEFDDAYAIYLQQDVTASFRQLARAVYEQMGGEGKVIQLTGPAGSSTAEERRRAAEEAAKEFPGIEIVATEIGGDDRISARPVFDGLLTSHSDVKGVVCFNDEIALGVISVLQERGKKDVKVGAADAIEEFLQLIADRSEHAVASLAIHGSWLAGFALARMYDFAHGVRFDPVERMLYQDALVLDTPESAAAYIETIYKPKTLPFDWRAMSAKLNPRDWNPQIGIAPLVPDEAWAAYPKPAGYELPAPLRRAIDAGQVERTKRAYLRRVRDSPIAPIIRETRSRRSVLGLT